MEWASVHKRQSTVVYKFAIIKLKVLCFYFGHLHQNQEYNGLYKKLLILLSQKVLILSNRGPVLELTAFVCLWNNSIDYIEEVIDAGILGVTNLTGTVYPGP